LSNWYIDNGVNTSMTILLTYYDLIATILNDADTTKQYNDPLLDKLYNQFDSNSDYLNYMIDHIMNTTTWAPLVKLIESTKTSTYANYVNYYNTLISQTTAELSRIAVYDNTTNTWSFTGSQLYGEVSKFTVGSAPFAWAKYIGHRLIKNMTLELDDQQIDSYDDQYMNFYMGANLRLNKTAGYFKMIGHQPELYTYDSTAKGSYMMTVPVIFSFMTRWSSAVPLCALQYCTTRLRISIRELSEVAKWDPNAYFVKRPQLDAHILGEFIYLEPSERKQLCETKLEYLYNFVQSIGDVTYGRGSFVDNQIRTRLFFMYSCRCMMWQVRFINIATRNEYIYDWTNNTCVINNVVITKPITGIKLKFYGRDREATKQSEYYNLVQPYYANMGSYNDNSFVYSFAFAPFEQQPTGAVNFAKIGEVELFITYDDRIVAACESGSMILEYRLYGYMNNTLRVMSGLCGAAFYQV